MDFINLIWVVCSILVWISSLMFETNAMRHDKLLHPKIKNSSKPSKSSEFPSRSSSTKWSPKSPPSSSSGKSKTPRCCENGGLCVMGVFCHCPKNFYGFRCEHQMRPCGPIAHMQWVRLGCNLCRCYDSKPYCLTRVYEGCDDKPPNKDVKVSEYEDDMEIFPQKTTTNPYSYDYYYDDYYNYSHSSSHSFKPHHVLIIMFVTLSLYCIILSSSSSSLSSSSHDTLHTHYCS